ncbi:SWIM zinc finger family protein [Paenibacillus alkalitolerans]|uniref:SWIM zinc finger family protein n=1 Tax=Paenibacillus alkalitolerans TaxID=2799335 RepID=UPI0018F56A2B|nr:SWIM zinc finger family protein [Paenibacillus alkalitolerans]
MNLNNLSEYVDPVILERGRQYLSGGHVHEIEEIDTLVFQAEVEGSELYEVTVELDEDGGVVSSECDCPYVYGPVCKHQAAVLLKLSRHMKADMPSRTGIVAPDSLKLPTLKELLESESKEKLIDLLLLLAADSDVAEQLIKLHVSKAGGSEELEECRKLIRSYIDANSDGYGFVNWRNVDDAVEGALMAAGKAREAHEAAEWTRAVTLNLCILEEMVDLLQGADDSSGTIGGVIDECLERIHEVTLECEHIPEAEQEHLFKLLLEASEDPRYEGWSDWQLDLLGNASRLAVTPDLRKEWDEHVSRLSSGEDAGTWSGGYFAGRVAGMRLQLLANEGEDRARDYLYSHLHFSDFRKKAIEEALENERYDEAVRLAEEGESQDQAEGLPGLVKHWKQLRYEAYRRSGKLDLQRELGVELALDGDYSYYKQVKDTYPASEWPPVYKQMLQQLEMDRWPKDIYTRILVEEQETERLLVYVQKQPSQIERFYPNLNEQFPKEVKELFQAHIEATAKQASTRNHYRDVCRIVRMLQKAAGKEEAAQTVRRLLAMYPNKPAFRDELSKV